MRAISSSSVCGYLLALLTGCAAPVCIEDGKYLVEIGEQVPLLGPWAETECPSSLELDAPRSATLEASDPGYRDDTAICTKREMVWLEGELPKPTSLALEIADGTSPGPVESGRSLSGDVCDASLAGYLFFSGPYRTVTEALKGARDGDANAFRWGYVILHPECLDPSVQVAAQFCARVYRATVKRQ